MTDLTDTRRSVPRATSQGMTPDLVAQHLAHLRSAGRAETTIDDRGELLRRLDADLPMGLYQAVTEELEEWLAGSPDKPWSRQTKATYYGHIVGFYRWASSPDRRVGLEFDPSAGLVRPTVPAGQPRPISSEELALARDLLTNPWRLYVELAAFAGLRAVEISRLDRSDVTKELIVIRRGKGDKPRVVFTSSELWRVVQPLPAGPIARRATGTRATATYVSDMTALELDRVGLPDVTLHRCRHWYATYLLDEEADIRSVQDAMGHGSLRTTAGYIAHTERQRAKLRRAVNALPSLAPAPN
jgi:integrase